MAQPDDFTDAGRAAEELLRAEPVAMQASYDAERDVLRVRLSNELEVAVPRHLLQELAGVRPVDLRTIEITPSGLGLHFPDADADLYLPGVLGGTFGTRAWMRDLSARGSGPRAEDGGTKKPRTPDAA